MKVCEPKCLKRSLFLSATTSSPTYYHDYYNAYINIIIIIQMAVNVHNVGANLVHVGIVTIVSMYGVLSHGGQEVIDIII